MTPTVQQRSKFRLVATVLNAVLCGAVELAALYLVVVSYAMSPRGPWDDDVLTAIEVGAFVGGLFAVLGMLLLALPIARRRLSRWWLLPPAVLLVAAVARFWWISTTYPAG